jgi:hypothetical protein
MKKDDKKAYLEVTPHFPLSGSIRRVGSKSVIKPRSGRRDGAIAPSDLAKVVQMHEVTQDTINLPFIASAMSCKTNVYNN